MVDSISKESQSTVNPTTTQYKIPPLEEPHSLWQRGLTGLVYIALALLATSVGLASIYYRLTHITVRDGLVNGRAVRIQAPIDGTIASFYAHPGVQVRKGQVLAMLAPLPKSLLDNSISEVVTARYQEPDPSQVREIQLVSAQQTLQLLNQQLDQLYQQEQILQTATVDIAAETAKYADAAVVAAVSQETAARRKYERFSLLLEKGAVSQHEVDELEAEWIHQQLAVEEAQLEQNISAINIKTVAQQVPNESTLRDLQSQQRNLYEEIQRQENHIAQLLIEQPLDAPQTSTEIASPIANSNNSLVPLMAPFDGVIYSTQHDAGELVDRPAELLSLLDCNELWVEVLISTDQARRIDVNQPIRIQRMSQPETIIGHVDFITAISTGEITKARAEALLPTVPANLIDQSLARIRVRIPANQEAEKSYQFCGVGESAKLTFGTSTSAGAFLKNWLRF
ncbi:hemolysin d [Leptolyngbya sp. Heron Island J]|uniref:HlyD family secretion protein n=1 Tax=Leptolyngbya sp. Heron Island J TaxID=1385935 RepID=UPI0003B9BBE3|nr:HlyD family efflux transporter periplasmic adaptor subunit [Leptolyngbya sp. Heron Island J]ESA33638.1 hemolysin d [Leptolyngbya sp. Heron Island J]